MSFNILFRDKAEPFYILDKRDNLNEYHGR